LKLTWKKFRLRFASAFGTGRANLGQRDGFVLRLQTEGGVVGYGEASPLPEFGGGTVEDVESLLREWQPKLAGCSPEEGLVRLAVNGPGSAAFLNGLDTALCDIMAQTKGKQLAAWLASGSIAQSVPVNATIGAPDNAVAAQLAKKAVADGFECIKLKVGMAQTVAGELERVAAVRAAIGHEARLRLDPNGAWTVAQAIATLRELEGFNLELIEQPVAAENLAGLAQVRNETSILIAADEAVTGIAAAKAVIEAGAADILVIKPMIVGGLRNGRKLIEMAQAAGLGVFVTTTIDSGIGIAAALHLAATLPEPGLACGLATASLLEATLVQQLPLVQSGRMYLPSQPGLGVTLNFAAL